MILIKRTFTVMTALALLLISSTGASAAEEEQAEHGGELARAIATADVSGFVQIRHTTVNNTPANDNDQDGFNVEMARAKISDDSFALDLGTAFYQIQVEVASGTLVLKDTFIGLKVAPELKLTFGQFKVPFGWAVLNSENMMQFADRALTSDILYDRDRGAMVSGKYNPFADLNIGYCIGAFSGEGYKAAQRNADEKYLYAGSLIVEPLGTVGKDESDLDADSPLVFWIAGGLTTTESNGRGETFEQRHPEKRYNFNFRLKYQGLSISAEWVKAVVDKLDSGEETSAGFERHGHYLQAGYIPYFATWIELAARTEVFDYSGQKLDTVDNLEDFRASIDFLAREVHTLGLNFFLKQHNAKVQVNYVTTTLLEGIPKDSSERPILGDALIVQGQLAFD